jgi:hypothetical protein
MGGDSAYEAGEARRFHGGNGSVPAPAVAPTVVGGGDSALQHQGREEGVRRTGKI